ncbi:pyridoxamine 5'-phosphate oxidase [Desulfospira joergensenii]|uniref:pyridoxamine 5'-phosphate oxidase n=1 Tax=Desulfospira joergensenii TaxID=53329 RepID=UPI0003B39BD9|nr:pyridoxamine 5'-phosphate oxidase [Desulfospira joergensenii]
MELKNYFETTTGTGVLSTADSTGRVDAAIYSPPHFIDGKLAFIMRDRLSRKNFESNPQAVYLFIENGTGYKGKRLYLTRTDEEKNTERIHSLKRREKETSPGEDLFLVFFEVNHERPLVGR